MSKTCPSCGYKPIGPYSDNCPLCAEPVRDVYSDGVGSSSPLGLPAWLRWGLGALVLGVAGCCGLGMWRMGSAVQDVQKGFEQAQKAMEADRKARTMVVAAEDLLRDFQVDPAAADRKYQGKHLVLSGVVERWGRGGGGDSFVILHAGDDQAKIKIECFFDFGDEDGEIQGQRLDKGRPITVRGEYSGHVSHVQVRGCMLVR